MYARHWDVLTVRGSEKVMLYYLEGANTIYVNACYWPIHNITGVWSGLNGSSHSFLLRAGHWEYGGPLCIWICSSATRLLWIGVMPSLHSAVLPLDVQTERKSGVPGPGIYPDCLRIGADIFL